MWYSFIWLIYIETYFVLKTYYFNFETRKQRNGHKILLIMIWIYFFKQEDYTYMYVKHYKQCFNGYKSYFTKIYKHKSTSQKDHVNAFIENKFA